MWKHIPQIQSIPWPRITQFMQEGACMKRNFNWLYCPQQSIAKWRVIPKDQISQIRNSHAHYGLYSDCLYTKLFKCLYTKLKTQYYLHKFEEHITQFWFLVSFKFHKMNNLQFSKRVKPLYLFYFNCLQFLKLWLLCSKFYTQKMHTTCKTLCVSSKGKHFFWNYFNL